MSASATTATFLVPIIGDEAGDCTVILQWALTTPQAVEFSKTLVAGVFNTVTFPTTSFPNLCVIIPPPGVTELLTLKGVTGDMGTPLGTDKATILYLGGTQTSTASIGLTLSAGTNRDFKFRLI
ncbi:MAG: hypothetical protein L0206_02485 [Actinobacteria bacterium]|nr:hypothetical protein [Actinomycetota bacterium]